MTCYADAVEEADTQLVDAAYCTALMVITLTHARPHFIDKIYTYEYFFMISVKFSMKWCF